MKLTRIELTKKLQELKKPYFTVADLARILQMEKKSLYVTINRLVKAGVLVRLKKNIYQVFTAETQIEKIANEIYFPSYLSFESALSIHGILSQLPHVFTFAALRPSKKIMIAEVGVEYSQLKKELFFGYQTVNGKNTALPEKALLDQLYLASRGLRNINIKELDLRKVNKSKLRRFTREFPPYVKTQVEEMEKYLGMTPVTGETGERV